MGYEDALLISILPKTHPLDQNKKIITVSFSQSFLADSVTSRSVIIMLPGRAIYIMQHFFSIVIPLKIVSSTRWAHFPASLTIFIGMLNAFLSFSK